MLGLVATSAYSSSRPFMFPFSKVLSQFTQSLQFPKLSNRGQIQDLALVAEGGGFSRDQEGIYPRTQLLQRGAL